MYEINIFEMVAVKSKEEDLTKLNEAMPVAHDGVEESEPGLQ